MFSKCLYFFNSKHNSQSEIQPLLEKEFKPIIITEPKPIQEQTIKISDPVFDLNIVDKLNFNKIRDYKSFLRNYTSYILKIHDDLNTKNQVLNILQSFRLCYKILVISEDLMLIKELKAKYEYYYYRHKEINDDNIFPIKIIKEMELIVNSL